MDVAPGPRLLQQVREVLRRHHYSFRTEKTYVFWIRDFIHFNDRGARTPTILICISPPR